LIFIDLTPGLRSYDIPFDKEDPFIRNRPGKNTDRPMMLENRAICPMGIVHIMIFNH